MTSKVNVNYLFLPITNDIWEKNNKVISKRHDGAQAYKSWQRLLL